MHAALVILGTRYACNIDYKGDWTCLELQLGWGLGMPGTVSDED